jgi:hypothetical protein
MGRMHFGVHRTLEDEADRLIKQSLAGVTSHKAKSDILTPWKDAERHRREVYTQAGVPDEAVRKGMFGRVANRSRPDLNSRDGLARANRFSSSLASFVDEHGVEPDDR